MSDRPMGLVEMPFDDYLDIKAASKTILWEMRKSCPLKAKAKLDGTHVDTDALRQGRIIHMCVLEHARFRDTYVRGPDGPLNKNPGRAAWKAHKERYGDDAIKGSEWDMAEAIRTAVGGMPKVAKLLDGQAERSMFWEDPETGVYCKGRPDLISEEVSVLLDLKSAKDASPSGFARACADLGYHVQAAHYLMGAQEVQIPRKWFVFLAVEKVEPFAGGIYTLDADAMEAGQKELDLLLRQWKWCQENDEWPGYGARWDGQKYLPATEEKLSLPGWAINESKARTGDE